MKTPIRHVVLAAATALLAALAVTACTNPTGPAAGLHGPTMSGDGVLNGSGD